MGISILSIILYLICVAAIFISCLPYIHILQLESYQNGMFDKWIGKNLISSVGLLQFSLGVGGFVLATLLVGVWQQVFAALLVVMGICVLVGGWMAYRFWRMPKKKPLVFTARVHRLTYCLLLLIVVGYMALSLLPGYPPALFLLMIGLTPFLVLLANLIMTPVENGVKKGFLKEAREILRERNDLIKIGITGSFGKTSSKFILQTILNEKYQTLASPASYNTPMGLTRVVREMLKPEHQVFIAEMGARYTHDIKDLVELVHPRYGLITSIGKQHLETFGSFENIVQTKYDLIRYLPEGGIGYLPNDEGAALAQYQIQDKKKRLFSLEKVEDAFVYAKDLRVDSGGSHFTLVCEQGETELRTVLLGKHNVLNILGACSVALDLGLTLEQIRAGVEKIEPIEHRLQLIPSPSGITVIDDAFNANPSGTKMALEVLQYFPGTKIIVTPGLVELGSEEKELNIQFGRDIAAHCDIAVIVGKRFAPWLKEGLLQQGFDMGAVVEYDDLDEVSKFIGAYAKAGDVVLFENDLPDNYL